jgi:drug/metabolite transporter (DMT)-like permease
LLLPGIEVAMLDRSEALAAVFGLSSAASWGAGDFCGGLATRRAPVVQVVVTSQAIGTSAMALLAIAVREPMPSAATFAWCLCAGVFGAVGLVALYRALATGSMAVAAPVSGILSAAVPVSIGAAFQGAPSTRQAVGFAIAFAAVGLVSSTRERGRLQHLTLAIAAGVGFGLFIAILGHVATGSVVAPVVAARCGSLALLVPLAIRRGELSVPPRSSLPVIACAGMCDAGGNAFLVLAAQAGRLDVAAVLSSFYAAATVLLARVVLGERLGGARLAGLVAALAAIALITSG